MDDFKKQIRRKLVASLIADQCKQAEHLIFREGWCTQERVIRFTTPFFRDLLGLVPNEGGHWKTGDSVMYEAENGLDSLVVRCVLCPETVLADRRGAAQELMRACRVPHAETATLKEWDLTDPAGDANRETDAFARLIRWDMPEFEQTLRERMTAAEDEPPGFTEGEAEQLVSQRYERNQKARAACLAHYGTACAVCGMDFGKAYGPEFAGKIEVHHVVPLSEIGEAYVVDPIRDLVPVCPNCHAALHSKPGGVYTVEELRRIRSGL